MPPKLFSLKALLACMPPSSTFKRAYDSIPRDRLWDHLHKCQMPSQLSVIKDMNHDDKYVLINGDKQASVQPTYGVKQGAHCPIYSQFTLTTLAAFLTGDRRTDRHTRLSSLRHADVLCADDRALTANNPNHMQQMLDNLHGYAQEMPVCQYKKF